ncbi:MAG TPA: exopolyphosphatase [Gammaproteobacteria bacterium]|nr:exopolyphosphatase [Gammaproteobacteria bacterium]
MSHQETIAAVDLGSNSFHMVVARFQEGRLQVIDRLREPVRLGAGLDELNSLTPASQQRAIECLERFGQRLRSFHPDSVRAVGTNTLRRATNAAPFLAAAEKALGHPIGIIGGIEEARLIYLGVAQNVADDKQRLVVDIGGGSTELILGRGVAPMYMESLEMGCVSMSQRYFPEGIVSHKAVDSARIGARLELEPVEAIFREVGCEDCVGSSGTIRTVGSVIAEAGWSDHGITRTALEKLLAALVKAGNMKKIDLDGLSPQRAPVFPGGVVILLAVFEALGVERMRVSDKALREGLLHDLSGRIQHEDIRARSVSSLAGRYHVSMEHAERVGRTALYCLAQLRGAWGLASEAAEHWLSWAALLHEIGLDISHDRYHHHGAYVVQHADIPGFSQQEQELLATLIRAHRRKFPAKSFKELPGEWAEPARRLTIVLRLSVLLHRSRTPAPLPDFSLKAEKKSLEIVFPDDWLEAHPLTRADLAQEASYLDAVGIDLQFC